MLQTTQRDKWNELNIYSGQGFNLRFHEELPLFAPVNSLTSRNCHFWGLVLSQNAQDSGGEITDLCKPLASAAKTADGYNLTWSSAQPQIIVGQSLTHPCTLLIFFSLSFQSFLPPSPSSPKHCIIFLLLCLAFTRLDRWEPFLGYTGGPRG